MSEPVQGLASDGAWWRSNFWHQNQQHELNHMSDGLRAVFGRSTERMDRIAENLANASTPGYRAGTILPKNFVGELSGRLIGHQWRVGTDLTPGSFKMTDRPLDFALQGDGFFVVRSPHGDFLTRNGSFEVTPDGVLTNTAGYPVIGDNGEPIQIPGGSQVNQVHVGEDGSLTVEGNQFATFRVEQVESERQLRRVGNTLFTTGVDNRMPATTTRVLGRTLETSNTTVYQELADMMVLSRSIEAAQRAQFNEANSQKRMMESLT